MLNWISRAESILTHGPWWWRPIGTVIVVAVLTLLYFALG